MEPRCGILIAVRNEEASIARCLDSLCGGLPSGFAEIVVVCNGCTDRTAEIAREFVSHGVRVLELASAGKARAIRAGEEVLAAPVRFFVDGDIEVSGHDICRLCDRLATDDVHLVSPRIVMDLQGCSRPAKWLNTVWQALPHGQSRAFHAVLGVSCAGRARWGMFPDLLADDSFIAMHFAPSEREIVQDAIVRTRPPRSFISWVRVRARWLQGLRQMRELGYRPQPEEGQRVAVAQMLFSPRKCIPAVAYVVARAMAAALSKRPVDSAEWYRDETSREGEARSPTEQR